MLYDIDKETSLVFWNLYVNLKSANQSLKSGK
jgi:hypothetical protein